MSTISTPSYLLDQAKRRFTPTVNTIPGMGAIEKRLLNHEWKQFASWPSHRRAAASRPSREIRGCPWSATSSRCSARARTSRCAVYNTRGPITLCRLADPAGGASRCGPDATQAVFSNRNKDYSQKGWHPVIGPFFNRGLMMLDFEEHMFHRRIMQEAFTRTRLTGYVEHIDQVATAGGGQRLADQ